MRNRWIHPIFAMVTVLACAPSMLAQTARPSGAPNARSAVPEPDLSGVWVNITEPSQTFNPR